MTKPIVLAISGASGSAFAVRLLEVLLAAGHTVHTTISPAAREVFRYELGLTIDPQQVTLDELLPSRAAYPPNHPLNMVCPPRLATPLTGEFHYHSIRDFSAGIASGSFRTGGMVVCPCSTGTLAAIAQGHSQNLIHRAADVHIKERRKLIVMPRETPLSSITLDNMKRLADLGVIVLPAMPGWYHQPQSLGDLVDFVVARICDQLDVPHQLMQRWGDAKTPTTSP